MDLVLCLLIDWCLRYNCTLYLHSLQSENTHIHKSKTIISCTMLHLAEEPMPTVGGRAIPVWQHTNSQLLHSGSTTWHSKDSAITQGDCLTCHLKMSEGECKYREQLTFTWQMHSHVVDSLVSSRHWKVPCTQNTACSSWEWTVLVHGVTLLSQG